MEGPITSLPCVFLIAGGDRRIRNGHPWAYSNEVRMDNNARDVEPGSLVELRRVDGKPVGIATFNPHALIAARIFSHDTFVQIDETFLMKRLRRALAIRERLFDAPFYRLVHAEADGLPGFIIDRFGDAVTVQPNTAGAELMLPAMMTAIEKTLSPSAVAIRADSPARHREGLNTYSRVAKGDLGQPVAGHEGDLQFAADLAGGQKTGWFYDQRDNRRFAAQFADGQRMLDVYCYGGGFGVAAAMAGATDVTGVDRSQDALDLARRTAELNGVADRCRWEQGDAFEKLEALADAGERYGLVATDPPAFVKTKKDLKSGLRGYRKLARLAAATVDNDGFLFIASCSYNVSPDVFRDEICRGIQSAGRKVRILRASGAGPDHPVHPNLPESSYLKGLMLAFD